MKTKGDIGSGLMNALVQSQMSRSAKTGSKGKSSQAKSYIPIKKAKPKKMFLRKKADY